MRSGFLRRVLGGLQAGISLWRTLRDWRPDAVHFFLPEAYLIGAHIALAASRAQRLMSRRSLNDYQVRHPLLARFERLLHPRMDALLGNATVVVEQLVQEGAPAGRTHLIRNGLNLARFADVPARAELRRSLDVGESTLVLLIVANIIPYKGHADLIDALARARAALPDFVLLCAGRDDGYGAVLRARAEAAGLAGRIRYLGARDDVPALMAASDIGLLCSHEEGLPNAAIEALAAGLPMVATRVGGVPEVVVDGVTGVLVPPHDPAAFADALLALALDAPRRTAFARAGRARAQAEFDADGCARAYATLYRSLAR
jgi:glycosyltransferase involved in cell wall biosynthesis